MSIIPTSIKNPREGLAVERAEWLKQMRGKAEKLYDHLSPQYWVEFGLYPDETHREYLRKFLERLAPHGSLLSAGCGAGRYDGKLLAAGHRVLGIDQSEGMLERARQHFPAVHYRKLGLQEMDFREEFEGAICLDALEHVCPEDYPGILRRFREALKPDGLLYFTLDLADANQLQAAYQRAKARGLPVVLGEVVDELDAAYEKSLGMLLVPGQLADKAVYHYYPGVERVRIWIEQAGLAIEAEGTGDGYEHFVVRRN